MTTLHILKWLMITLLSVMFTSTVSLIFFAGPSFHRHPSRNSLIRNKTFPTFQAHRASNGTPSTVLQKVNSTHENQSGPTVVEAPCYKRVYIWLDERDAFHVKLIVHQRTGEFPCPGLSCGVSVGYGRDYLQLEASDVVFLFYKTAWDWEELMKYRSARQKWVFWTSESPKHTHPRVIPPPKYRAIAYDYLMTYRTTGLTAVQADAMLAGGNYGSYNDSLPLLRDGESKNWASNKTKMAAWVVTNCHSRTLSWGRTEFVKALQKHVAVDIFGPCGTQPCRDLASCGLQQYKFYLALENSECDDYITEKFWYNALTLGLLPIVYGPPKSQYVNVAPPNSFIHIQDFGSVSELAAYMRKLDEDDELYNQYFEWTRHGRVTWMIQFSQFIPENLCRNVVSRVLADETQVTETKLQVHDREPIVSNLDDWWLKSCHPLGSHPVKLG